MKSFKTEQEKFWAGEFGREYIGRNNSIEVLTQNIFLFSKIIAKTENIKNVIEYGANIGLNLRAIKSLLPEVKMEAVEINKEAFEELSQIDSVKAYNKSILDFKTSKTFDFVLIKTVMIHLNPEFLPQVYELLYKSSSRYICIAEFYNPTATEVQYRGYEERLFKRDFAGELMDKYTDLRLIDYGFSYHRDRHFPKTDVTWFLMEKIQKS